MDAKQFSDTFKLSADATPIYEQILSYFRMMIRSNALKAGEQLITEGEICQILKISRTTVRQAFDQLVSEGLVVRYRRKGSFVSEAKIRRPVNYLYNFSENIRELGYTPHSVVLDFSVIVAEGVIREQLQPKADEAKAFFLRRLRCAGDEPIIIEETYIPYYLCPDIEKIDFSTNSLYEVLSSSYGLNILHATETIEAIGISKGDAELLGCKNRNPGYRITRVSEMENGYRVEYTTSVTRADRCMFELELFKNPQNAKNMPFMRRKVKI